MNFTYYQKLLDIYNIQGVTKINKNSKDQAIFLRLFIFYEHFNADDTLLDELEETIFDFSNFSSIIESKSQVNAFDLINVFDQYKCIMSSQFDEYLLEIDSFFLKLFNGYKEQDMVAIRNQFVEFKITDTTLLTYTLLFSKPLDVESKVYIRDVVSGFESKLSNLSFTILFDDEVEEIVRDVEQPTLFVSSGKLKAIGDQKILYGPEKSLVVSISANSLKELYINYATKGLFASNLRYYVKSTKIDASIKTSILREPEKFWYYNNGIIITCQSYVIVDGFIEFKNFSIVNGGQTTSIIGNTQFEQDFALLCKIIQNKYEDKDINTEFLGKVAEATNTQKPIKSKDLISNRIEQKRIKEQLAAVDIFVSIKRGEKINKEIFKARWQNASNDELGQMIFSFIYQHPGIARNSKSKMLENEEYYQTIYSERYNTMLLVTLQHIKGAYHSWKQTMNKISRDSEKLGLVKNGFFLFVATIEFLAKYFYNERLVKATDLFFFDEDVSENEEFRRMVTFNDIGQMPILIDPSLLSLKVQTRNDFFDYIYHVFIQPSYVAYRQKHPYYAYSNFTKNDTNYYRFVIPTIISQIKKNRDKNYDVQNFMKLYFDPAKGQTVDFLPIDQMDTAFSTLFDELKRFRREKYRELQGTVKQYQILTNNQLTRITTHKPRDIESLTEDCKLTMWSIENFGEQIISIVSKYLAV